MIRVSTIIRVSALLLGAALALEAGGQPQQIYRWKDAQGRQHVTNSPPPPGATALDVPQTQAPQPGKAAAPVPEAPSPPVPSAPPSEVVEAPEWRGFSARLDASRKSQNADAAATLADGLIDEALWGGVSKALPLLPLATFALVALLGWWIGSGLKRGMASLVMTLAILAGLALAQFTLSSFLYQSQFARIQQRLSALESHLGSGRSFSPQNRERIRNHLRSLETKATPLAAPWAFPKEIQALRDFLGPALFNP